MSEARSPDIPWSEEHLRLAIKAACVALWSWNVDSNSFYMDARGFELWGIPHSAHVSFEDLSEHIHPADRDRVRAAFVSTRSVAGSYEIDFRIIVEDEIRWIQRAAVAPTPNREPEMFGISSTSPGASRRRRTSCLPAR